MNKLVILNNKIFQVHLEDEHLMNLRNYLSFKLTGVEYSTAYKNGNWNGVTCMVNTRGQIPIGLLPRTRRWLKQNKIEFVEESNANPIDKVKSIDLYTKLKELGMTPRDYQEEIANVTDISNRGIIRACTGAGKSLAAAMMIAKLGKPANLFVISLDLLEQFHKFFSKIFDEEIGYIGNGICNVKRINIVSIWTVGRALDVSNILLDDEIDSNEKFEETDREKIFRCLADAQVFILDECHVASTSTIKAIYKAIDPEYLYGMSGTPFREDNSDLLIEGFLSEILIDIPASELIAKGFLVQPLIKFINVPPMRTSDTYHQIYQNYIAENKVRNKLIVDNTKDLVEKGYRVLVLFKQIKHGDILAEAFEDEGLKFGYLHGKNLTEEREIVKQDFVDKKINIILASTIFDIGLDFPSASGLVLAGGGKSAIRAQQRLGRILRIHPGKKYAAVIDFYDQVKYLKKHSARRHEIYSYEPGFKVFPPVLKKSK